MKPSRSVVVRWFTPTCLVVGAMISSGACSASGEADGSAGEAAGGSEEESSGGRSIGGRPSGGRSSGGRASEGGEGGERGASGGARAGTGGRAEASDGGASECLKDEEGGCVECLEASDCTGASGGDLCHPTRHDCVECIESADCMDPEASLCTDEGECVPCQDPIEHSDCAHIEGGRNICDTSRGLGECVECTLSFQEACGPDTLVTCDLVARQCVPIGLGDRGVCEPCTNDLQCVTDHLCIPMTFQGEAHGEGGYCLRKSPGCARPYLFGGVTRVSLGGSTPSAVCAINESLTTCEAVLALVPPATICEADEDCPKGGLCRSIDGSLDLYCTYGCTSEVQCRPSVEASAVACPFSDGDPANDYCGGQVAVP
jgi:hypothetical protein